MGGRGCSPGRSQRTARSAEVRRRLAASRRPRRRPVHEQGRYKVPATGVVDYQYFTVDPGFKEDKWIKAIEARPSNRAVLHHIIVFASPKGAARDEGRRQFLVGYAPGAIPMVLPPGYAKLLPAGYELLFQVHYTPNGKAGVGPQRRWASSLPIRRSQATSYGRSRRSIRASRFRRGRQLRGRIRLIPLCLRRRTAATLPAHAFPREGLQRTRSSIRTASKETLLDVPHYDFNWQLTYELRTSRVCPRARASTAWPTSTTRKATWPIPIRSRRSAGATRPGKK